MALLIYMKGDPKAIIVKESMKDLEEIIGKVPAHELNDMLIRLEGWHGNKIMFCHPFENWSHVVEEKDEVIKKQLADMNKAQKDKQAMMNKSRNPDLISKPHMMFPSKRGN